MSLWKDFEKLAATIYGELSPTAKVTHNDKILGTSGEPRQIDVSIRATVAGHAILVVIETKDYQRRADIGEVDKFAGKLQDVRANRGILICSAGFTRGACKAAQTYGIHVCNLHDAQSRNWKLDINLPVLWVDLKPNVRFMMETYFEAGDSIENDPSHWIITPDGGKSRLKLLSTFERVWNEGKVPRTVGPKHTVRSAHTSLRVLVRNNKGNDAWRPVHDLSFVYTVSRKSWLGAFTPEECRGVFHYSDSRFEPSYLPIGSIPRKRDESWQEVDDPHDLAISIPGTIITTEGWQVALGTGEFTDLEVIRTDE